MHIKDLALHDVRCVARGLAADGITPLAKRLSFPRDDDVLKAAAALVGVLYDQFARAQSLAIIKKDQRTALVFKLLAHLSRTGRQTPGAIARFASDIPLIADVFGCQPHLVTARVNIAGILRRHRLVESAHRVGWRFPTFPDTPPPRPVIWTSADGRYRLQELIHPRHLIVEGKALCHCIGQPKHNLKAGEPLLANLRYWLLVASGQSRIFSFGSADVPLITLHISLNPPVLREAGGDPFASNLPAFLDALTHLATLFPGLSADEALGKPMDGILKTIDAKQRGVRI